MPSVGQYKIVLNGADADNYEMVYDENAVLTVDKKDISIYELKVLDKDYDGNINAVVDSSSVVFEALDASVDWNGAEKKVTINKNDGTEIVVLINYEKAYVDNKEITLDSAAFIENNRTYLPIRIIAESLGAKVDWDGNNKQVIITKENTKIVIAIGSKEAFVNYKAFSIDSPPIIRNGRTYVPVRFVTENLGAKVDWNGDGKTITITK